jgi:hypothetical protein
LGSVVEREASKGVAEGRLAVSVVERGESEGG